MNTKHYKLSIVFFLAVLIPCFGITEKSQGDLLGSWTFSNHIFVGGPPVIALTPSYWFSTVPFTNFPPTTEPNLFENLIVSPNDIGVTWTVTAATDPDFTEVVSILTDDLMSHMGIFVFRESGSGISFFSSESDLFFGFGGDPDLMPFRDFAGSTIDSFSVTLDDFFITQDGVFNVSNFTFTFGVHGTIPGPGGTVGFVILLLVKRKRRD